MGESKLNVNAVLDKIAGMYNVAENNPIQDEIELQADYLKDYTKEVIQKDRDRGQRLWDKAKYTPKKTRKYKSLKDAYANPMTLNGAENPLGSYSSLNYNNLTLNWWLSISMYDNSGIFKIAVDTLAQDLIKAGITPNLDNVIKKKHAQKLYNRVKPDLISAMKNTQLFGGAIGVMMFDTVTDYSLPPNFEQIKKAKKMVVKVFDRWQLNTDKNKVKDLMDDDYGLPQGYTVMTSDDNRLSNVHHGYVMRFIIREAPKIVKDIFQGWGYSQLSHVYTELMKDQQLKHNIVSLTNKALLEVVQMSGMKGLFSALADPESQAEIEARLEMVNRYRNNNSLIFLDKDDAYNQFTFGGLSGLADLMESNKDDMSAILEMSKLLLFGDTKGGLSGNADSEYLWYQGKISGKQEEYLKRPLDKLVKYICLMSGADEDEMVALDYEFNTIIPEKATEKAERFEKFVSSLKELKEIGVYDDEDVKQEVIAHADEYGVGIAPYKLKSIYDLREQEKKDKEESEKKVKFKIRPLVHVERFRVVPTSSVTTEKVKLVPEAPVKTEIVKLVPKDEPEISSEPSEEEEN